MKPSALLLVIRAYLICALTTSVLGFLSCVILSSIEVFILVLIYMWIICSPISVAGILFACLCGAPKDWIKKPYLNCLCALLVFIINITVTDGSFMQRMLIKFVPDSILYYNNGIENRINDTVMSICKWIFSFVFLFFFILITSTLYKYVKRRTQN